jgi:four helix bundle protein
MRSVDKRTRVAMSITSHKDLVVWQKSIAVATKVYAATRLLPSDERRGLGRQLRRAAVSVASTIAEGAARKSRAEFIQFLHIARGSLSELETQLLIVADQALVPNAALPIDEVGEIGRLLNGLIRSLATAHQ